MTDSMSQTPILNNTEYVVFVNELIKFMSAYKECLSEGFGSKGSGTIIFEDIVRGALVESFMKVGSIGGILENTTYKLQQIVKLQRNTAEVLIDNNNNI